jgi:hypothetical protein
LAFAGAGTPRRATILALIREWNKNVKLFNKRNVGLRWRRARRRSRQSGAPTSRCVSRGLAEETSLGLQTVCTILDQQDDVDRSTIKQLQRIDPDPARERVWQAKRQMRQALPREIAAVEKANAELRQVAKGLKIKHHVTA